jgi:large subunit ribosomal protein L7/L12
MSELTREQVVDYLSNLPVIELAQLIPTLEQKWGVSAAPVAIPGGASTPGPVEAVEEQTEFSVVLDDAGAQKVNVIKAVREITQLGLKEAKDKVDAAPVTILEGATKEAATECKAKLELAGAKVTIK